MCYIALVMFLSRISQRKVVCAFFGLIVTLSLFTTFGERGVLHLWRLWEEKRKLDEKTFLLQKENEILRERVYGLRHDSQYLEKIAREDLGLVRPGEIVYRFASSESKKNRTRAISELRSELPRSLEQKSPP